MLLGCSFVCQIKWEYKPKTTEWTALRLMWLIHWRKMKRDLYSELVGELIFRNIHHNPLSNREGLNVSMFMWLKLRGGLKRAEKGIWGSSFPSIRNRVFFCCSGWYRWIFKVVFQLTLIDKLNFDALPDAFRAWWFGSVASCDRCFRN